jgi:hypothetical protein
MSATEESTVKLGVADDVSKYIKLDTEMKIARKQMREVGVAVEGYKKNIIEYMVKTKTDKLVGINGGTQYLECVNKTLKRRPTSEQMLFAIGEALKSGINDPSRMLDIIQNCGGTVTEYRLSRRTRRMNVVAAAAMFGKSQTKEGSRSCKQSSKKKRKINITET